MDASSMDVLQQLTSAGALQHGHFLLASGRHSAQYVEKFTLLRQPGAISRICEGFAATAVTLNAEVIAGPTTGGIILAFEVGRQTGLPAVYAERKTDGSAGREFRRGTTFLEGARVFVVDDILTTGGSVRETLLALREYPVEVAGIGVLVDRSGGAVKFGDIPVTALATLSIETWEPASCPLCMAGEALVKPGTTQQKTG